MSKPQDIGGIYSDQKCPMCGGSYVDDLRSALRCPDHPQHIAGRLKVKIRNRTARFDNYMDASNYLKMMREAAHTGTMDYVDMTLDELLEKFIRYKNELASMGKIRKSTPQAYANRLLRIINGMRAGIKLREIRYADLHTWLYGTSYSVKSKYDSFTCFKEMANWARNMEYWTDLPFFPSWDFDIEDDMERKEVVCKSTQRLILEQISKNESERPRVYVGIKFLCTYINIRPNELRMVNEGDINVFNGTMLVRHRKTGKKPKVVKLLPEDVELVRSLRKRCTDFLPIPTHFKPFLRHEDSGPNWRVGDRFSPVVLYRAWKKACSDLGIDGVDLYRGTRHSSAISLYKDAGVSPGEIMKATGHKTSKAFSRYFEMDTDDVLEIHKLADPNKYEIKVRSIKDVVSQD